MYRPAMTAGCIFAGLAVVLGAFGAHALKEVLSAEQLITFETGVKYEFYHSLALLACGIAYAHIPAKQLRLTHVFFILGIICFSGSLYAMTLLNVSGGGNLGPIGIVTPIGGLFFIIGWLMFTVAMVRKQ